MKTTNRPEITEERLAQIRKTISDNPGMGRTKLSVVLCEIWGWRDAGDRVKDMSCRDLLSSLEKAGRINLPPRIRLARKPGDAKDIKHLVHDETPIVRKLGELQPLNIEVVTSVESMARFQSYIDQHHYLKFDRFIGAGCQSKCLIDEYEITGMFDRLKKKDGQPKPIWRTMAAEENCAQ